AARMVVHVVRYLTAESSRYQATIPALLADAAWNAAVAILRLIGGTAEAALREATVPPTTTAGVGVNAPTERATPSGAGIIHGVYVGRRIPAIALFSLPGYIHIVYRPVSAVISQITILAPESRVLLAHVGCPLCAFSPLAAIE